MTARPGRRTMFAIILLFQPFIQLDYLTYTLDAARASHALGVGLDGIATLTTIPGTVALFLLLPAGWLADRIGLRPLVWASCAALACGGMLRLLWPAYPGLALAQMLMAAAGPLLGGASGPFLRRWFRPDEIVWASILPQAFLMAGLILSFLLVPRLYAAMDFWPGLRALSIAAIVFAVCAAVLMPPDPPDPARRGVGASLIAEFAFLRHGTWWMIAAIYFFGNMFFNALIAWVGSMLGPQHFTPTQAGEVGAAFIAGGIAGVLTIPSLAVRLGRPKLVLLGAGMPMGIAVLSLVQPRPLWQHIVAGLVIGFNAAAGGPVLTSWTACFAGPDLGKALSLYGLVTVAGGALGTKLLPMFVHGNDWTLAAWMLVLWLSLPAPFFILLRVPQQERTEAPPIGARPA